MKLLICTLFNSLLVCCLLAQKSTLKAEYFNGTNFEQKVTTRTESNIDKSWNDVPPVPGIDPHFCSIRWTGKLTAPESGTYTFSAQVDDGIRVWVGGVMVIDDWKLNDNGNFTGQVKMSKGVTYNLKVEYFNALIEGEVRLLWTLPSAKSPAVVASKHFIESPKPQPQKVPQQTEKKPANNTPPKSKTAPNPTAPAKPQSPAPTIHVDTLEKYLPKNVLFEQGKATMLDKSKPALDNLADYLRRNPQLKLKIEGHTDIIGDMEMNKTLSEERAKTVAEYLASKGIDGNRLEAEGFGSTRPLITGNVKKGYPENRRVAFIIW